MDSNSDPSSDEAVNEPPASRHGPLPILPGSGRQSIADQDDRMDTTTPTSGPAATFVNNGTNGTANAAEDNSGGDETTTNGNGAQAAVAATTANQPKVVQTAFIHKLYNMLEDPSIQNLISWSRSGDSFVISPTSDFSKVLASYFKHTNISSFVRQLNMYGFHKVSDVFATGGDSPLWEFRHGGGSFKRGDLAGLRDIKRRASKQHTFLPREPVTPQPRMAPPPPALQPEIVQDTLESRVALLEQTIYDVHGRLLRSEESHAFFSMKCQALSESLHRCYQFTHDMSTIVMNTIQDPGNQAYREALAMQKEVARQMESLKSQEDNHDISTHNRQPLFTHNPFEPSAPLSPRQLPQDDQRRHSVASISSRSTLYRPQVSSNLASGARGYVSSNTPDSSPPSIRAPVAQLPTPTQPTFHQPHQQHTTTAVSPPAYLSRRHTSADIRLHGWQGPPGSLQNPPPLPGHPTHQSPFASGNSSSQWPSSPNRTPHLPPSDPNLHDTLSRYQFPSSGTKPTSRHASPGPTDLPPLAHSSSATNLAAAAGSSNNESGWTVPGSRWTWTKGAALADALNSSSGPPTRRSSMASNVHNLLNPAETAEREGEDEGEGPLGPADDGRGKRKRVA